MTVERTHKKFKGFTVARRVFIALTVAFCIAPIIFAAICIVPEVENLGDKWILSSGVLSMLAIVIFVLRAVIKGGSSKLPWSVTVFISVLLLFLLALALKALGWYTVGMLGDVGGEATLLREALKLIEDAYGYLILQAVGAAAGVICELSAAYCKSMLEEIKLFFNKEE